MLVVGLDTTSVMVTASKTPETVTIRIDYQASLLSTIPFALSGAFPPITIKLATQATMRREQ